LSELYLSKKPAGASSWDAAAPMADVNDPAAHETLPFVVRTGSELTLLYVKMDASNAVPWENASADVYVSKSSDGAAWSAPQRVTDDDPATFTDVFPGAYPDLSAWSMIRARPKPSRSDVCDAARRRGELSGVGRNEPDLRGLLAACRADPDARRVSRRMGGSRSGRSEQERRLLPVLLGLGGTSRPRTGGAGFGGGYG
jgi:hypothetical protein